MSQSTVEIQQGHRTNATESREGAEELATAYSSSILDDRPMSLTALDALDQMATNYIEYSKLLKSATPAPPQHAGRYMSSVHSSALPDAKSMEWCEGVAQQYSPIVTGHESEPEQLTGTASWQNEVGHDAHVTKRNDRLGQNRNVELTSKHEAGTDPDISVEETKGAAMAGSNLPMCRRLERGMNEENATTEELEHPLRMRANTETTEQRASKRLKQKAFQMDKRKNDLRNDLLELKREQEVFQKCGLEDLSRGQSHRRMSRADSKIAARRRGRRGKKHSEDQRGYSPSQISSSGAVSGIPGPADGVYPAASHAQNQQPLPNNVQTNTMAEPDTQLRSTPRRQGIPTPLPPLLVAICHGCKVRITDFSGSPYDLPTSCPICQRPLTYRPFEGKSPSTPKVQSRFRPSPLDQRPAARAALNANGGINPRLSTVSALKTGADEPKRLDGQARKRRWTAGEKNAAKVAKRVRGGERREEAGAVHVDSKAVDDDDDDDVVFIREITRNEIESINGSMSEHGEVVAA